MKTSWVSIESMEQFSQMTLYNTVKTQYKDFRSRASIVWHGVSHVAYEDIATVQHQGDVHQYS